MMFKPYNGTLDDEEQRLQANISSESFLDSGIFTILKPKGDQADGLRNIIAVIGNPGSGKSALLKAMLQHPTISTKYDYVFFLQCRHIDCDAKMNLLQLLVTTLPYQWIQDEEICRLVLEELEKNENVLILIDDYDERIHVAVPEVTSVEEKATPPQFVQSILSRKILVKAKITVTTHIYFFNKIKTAQIKIPTLEILGLNAESRKNLCENICGEKANEVLRYIITQQFLYAFCDVPENCSVVMYIVSAFLRTPETSIDNLPLTRVVIASYAKILQLKNLKPNVAVIKAFADLAWQKLNQRKTDITEKELPDHNHFELISTLINCQKENNFKCIQKFYVVWRNILAAIFCIFCMRQNDIKRFFNGGYDELVGQNARMIVSAHIRELCDPVTRRYLRKVLSSEIQPERLKLVEGID